MGEVPSEARFEVTVASDVAIWDVVSLLPKGPGEYRFRDPASIVRLYVHKSGADGPPGFKGAEVMASYCTRAKPSGRGWPGAPYHFWIPRDPDKDLFGRYAIYRTQRDGARSFHTGGAANEHGLSACLQGAYDGQWDLLSTGRPRIEIEPTDIQKRMFSALVDWCATGAHYALVGKSDPWLSGHWEADRFGGHSKPVCPGDWARAWVMNYRKSKESDAFTTVGPIEPVKGELYVEKPSVKDLQRALKQLGHDPGPIDGIWGFRSRIALERFQLAEGLEPDGWYGQRSANALLLALRAKGISKQDAWERKVS